MQSNGLSLAYKLSLSKQLDLIQLNFTIGAVRPKARQRYIAREREGERERLVCYVSVVYTN